MFSCYEAAAVLSFLAVVEIEDDGYRNHQNQYDARNRCAACGNKYLASLSRVGALYAGNLRGIADSRPDNNLFCQRGRVGCARRKNHDGAACVDDGDKCGRILNDC